MSDVPVEQAAAPPNKGILSGTVGDLPVGLAGWLEAGRSLGTTGALMAGLAWFLTDQIDKVHVEIASMRKEFSDSVALIAKDVSGVKDDIGSIRIDQARLEERYIYSEKQEERRRSTP